jgi:hypothetical protein
MDIMIDGLCNTSDAGIGQANALCALDCLPY